MPCAPHSTVSVAEFVDDALGSTPARDDGAEESKAPGFVPRRGEAPYVTAEQELRRRALDESARLERREEERDDGARRLPVEPRGLVPRRHLTSVVIGACRKLFAE